MLFDLYETLVTERGIAPVRASSLGERLGLDAAAFRLAWKPQRIRVLRGQVSFGAALHEVAASLGQPADAATVRTLSHERRTEKAALFDRFDPEALGVLCRLRDRGIRLAVVSNCFPEDVAAWPGCPAASCFDATAFSFEVGAVKPEAPIYLHALQRFGVAPDAAWFVGDGGDDELPGARRAGLHAAQAGWFRDELPGLPAGIPRLTSWAAVAHLPTAG